MTYKHVAGVQEAKRLGMLRMSDCDWFVGYSPRNGVGASVEGPWAHWVEMAISILAHPATEKIRPAAFEAVKGVEPVSLYSGGEVVEDLTPFGDVNFAGYDYGDEHFMTRMAMDDIAFIAKGRKDLSDAEFRTAVMSIIEKYDTDRDKILKF